MNLERSNSFVRLSFVITNTLLPKLARNKIKNYHPKGNEKSTNFNILRPVFLLYLLQYSWNFLREEALKQKSCAKTVEEVLPPLTLTTHLLLPKVQRTIIYYLSIHSKYYLKYPLVESRFKNTALTL